ncbi:CPBP family intramembrane glutamic endopeptidase [Dethiothermospora halolimnae]|uniref:CPBP family intramembrane glutamic endopeptidase n=1 Tax=Dethiothermospora halolimnae TaxID=3114390 RepID=UPI003CCBED5E
MKNLFINNNNQLKLPWKIILALIIAFIFTIIFSMIGSTLGIEVLSEVSIFIAFIASTLIMIKLVGKKTLINIGFKSLTKNYKSLLWGLLFGALLVIFNLIILVVIGDSSFATPIISPNFTSNLIKQLLIFILAALGEEMFFRGYFITSLQQMKKDWLAIIIASAIWAFLHGANPSSSLLPIINIILAGLLLSYLFIKTKNIWIVVGFHISWNYLQGNVFGIKVSGRDVGDSIYLIDMKDTLMSGGSFGLEGGLANTIVLLSFLILLWFIFNKMEKIKKHL